MVYFANFADNNFCLRGCNAGSIDPNNIMNPGKIFDLN